MTHDELLDIIERHQNAQYEPHTKSVTPWDILQTIVELHNPNQIQEAVWCTECSKRFENSGWYEVYPCPTIQAIEKELE